MYLIQEEKNGVLWERPLVPMDAHAGLGRFADALAAIGIQAVIFRESVSRPWWVKVRDFDQARFVNIVEAYNSLDDEHGRIKWAIITSDGHLIPMAIEDNHDVPLGDEAMGPLAAFEQFLKAIAKLQPVLYNTKYF